MSGCDTRRWLLVGELGDALCEPWMVGYAYRLVPILRLINDDDSCAINGSIPASRIDSACVAAVYLYQGKVTADDIGGNGAQPYSSTNVVADGSGAYRYTAAFLPEGTYTLALTCHADQDDRSEEHTSEPQSLMRSSYAVFCLNKKQHNTPIT